MRTPPEQVQSAAQIVTNLREARAKLEAANHRFNRAVAESKRLKALIPSSIEENPSGEELDAALAAAESDYRVCLEALKADGSDAARWRCARALIEFDQLSDLAGPRRAR